MIASQQITQVDLITQAREDELQVVIPHTLTRHNGPGGILVLHIIVIELRQT